MLIAYGVTVKNMPVGSGVEPGTLVNSIDEGVVWQRGVMEPFKRKYF